jgi:hypothetical protein
MSFTPVIPPMPSPDGRGSRPVVQPPVVPAFSPETAPATPGWMNSQQAGPNYAAAYPTSTPYAPAQYLSVPGAVPMNPLGSYFPPPVGLPYQMGTPMPQLRSDGFASDWAGFGPPGGQIPQTPAHHSAPPSAAASPWPPANAPFPGMQYQAAAAAAAAGMYTGFQPAVALPAGYPWGGIPPQMAPQMATPWAQQAMTPAWPPQMATPMSMPGGFGGQAPPAQNQRQTHAARPSRALEILDRFDKFSADNSCTSISRSS